MAELQLLDESEDFAVDPDLFVSDEDLAEGEGAGGLGLSPDDIVAIITQDIENAESFEDAESQDSRIQALDYYMERPRGDEVEGRSRVVSSDFADVVEWVMPEILKAYNSPDGTIQFEPVDDEDVAQARLETEATHYAFYARNNGFLYLYTLVKDALMTRNAIGKVYQDESVKISREEHTGLNDSEFADLLNPSDNTTVIPLEHEEYQIEAPAPPHLQAQGIQAIPVTLHDITVKRIRSKGRPRVENIARECFLINADHTSIDIEEARFTGHIRDTTEGDLILEGWDPKLVRDIPTYQQVDEDGEAAARRDSGAAAIEPGQSDLDRANRPIRVYECYKRLDVEGDGYPELYMVHVAGDAGGYKYMGHEAVDELPFVCTTSNIMTHTFEGRSLFDRIKQIADLKTTLLRNILDNIYFTNNQRHEVVAGMVNLDDMLTNRPGGMVRVKAPGMINPITVAPVGPQAYSFLEYLDRERGNKVGVAPEDSRQNNKLPTDTAHGIERIMSAKEELVGLMIRIIGETGIGPTMMKFRNLLVRYQDSEMPAKVSGRMTTVQPRNWKDTRTLKVATGLSSGDRGRKVQTIREVISQQATVAAQGGKGTLVTDKNLYRGLTDFVRFSQLGDVTDYWQDPDSEEARQYIADQQRRAEEEQAKQGQFEKALVQIQALLEEQKMKLEEQKMLLDAQKDSARQAFDYTKLAEDVANKMTELELGSGKDVPGSRV